MIATMRDWEKVEKLIEKMKEKGIEIKVDMDREEDAIINKIKFIFDLDENAARTILKEAKSKNS